MNEWSILSRKVLSSVMVDTGAIFPVVEIAGEDISAYSPDTREIAAAVFRCLNDGVPPFVDSVTSRMSGDDKIGYARVIAAQFNATDNSNIVSVAKELIEIAKIQKVRSLGKVMMEAKGEDVSAIIKAAEVALSGLRNNGSRRPSDSRTVDAKAWEMITDDRYLPVPSGMSWFDQANGGFWPGENYWVVAPYKSRKTTIARNSVLASARAGFPVAFFAAEGQREVFALDCQCMLATEHIIKSRLKDNPSWGGFNSIKLSSKRLMIAFRSGQGALSEEETEGMAAAREEWNKLPVYVYDGVDKIRDLAALRYIIERDVMDRGIRSFWIDHSQLFGSEGNSTLYDRQSETSRFIQTFAADKKIVACALSQQNEESIKYAGRSSYSPGVKGGGDAPAASDVSFMSYVDPDVDYILHIEIKLGRSIGKSGHDHLLNTHSGLFVDKWFSFRKG